MKPGQTDLLVFDLDGTLIDSRQDITSSVNVMRAHCGLETIPAETISCFVGNGVHNLIRGALGEQGQDQALFKKALSFYRDYYWEHMLDHTALYPGVRETLAGLSGVTKVVFTNKPEKYSVEILRRLGAADFFIEILSGGEHFPKKPDPAGMAYLIEKYRVAGERMLMVGDSRIDVETGRNSGARTCFVTYGFGKKEDLLPESADYMINEFTALTSLLF